MGVMLRAADAASTMGSGMASTVGVTTRSALAVLVIALKDA
jgi:hypothetical protein